MYNGTVFDSLCRSCCWTSSSIVQTQLRLGRLFAGRPVIASPVSGSWWPFSYTIGKWINCHQICQQISLYRIHLAPIVTNRLKWIISWRKIASYCYHFHTSPENSSSIQAIHTSQMLPHQQLSAHPIQLWLVTLYAFQMRIVVLCYTVTLLLILMLMSIPINIIIFIITRCSATAERPRCRVSYSFRQK